MGRWPHGRTSREIRRCLKRYFARQMYRQPNAETASNTAAEPPTASATSTAPAKYIVAKFIAGAV